MENFWSIVNHFLTLYNILSTYLTPFNIEAKDYMTIKTSIYPGFYWIVFFPQVQIVPINFNFSFKDLYPI